jgi:hypothetical protein
MVKVSALPAGRNTLIEGALYRGDTSVEELKELSIKQAERLLKDISERVPQVRDSICYLDVVFLLPNDSRQRSRGYAASPLEVGIKSYEEFVKALVTDEYDVAGHPVFQVGLPCFKMEGGRTYSPKTYTDLKALRLESKGPIACVEGGIFTIDLTDEVVPAGRNEGRALKSVHAPGDPCTFATTYWNIPRDTESGKYGGLDRSIEENFEVYGSRIAERRWSIADCEGRPLSWITAAPICWWVKEDRNTFLPVQGGSFIIGTSKPLTIEDVNEISKLVTYNISAGYVTLASTAAGEQQQKITFAHHTSAAIDSILREVNVLPEELKGRLPAVMLAKLHLLRAAIASYRSNDTRVDIGEFPYPWEGGESPLAVYRDVGIQLGFARAQDAPELSAQEAAEIALQPENRLGEPGFDDYRRALFKNLPDIKSKNTIRHLKHSNFAVLILIALKQAVYHTIRARCRDNVNAQISINVREDEDDIIFECTVINPSAHPDENSNFSKDANQLRDLATRLSHTLNHDVRYSVEGPRYVHEADGWLTTTRIHSKV